MNLLVRRTLGVATLICLVFGIASCAHHEALDGTVVDQRAPNFTLIDQSGKPFTLAAQRGHEVVLFFGYTHCPDICPTTMAQLAAIIKHLTPAERSALRVAFITVDPQRDTPAALGRYVRLFDPSFYGLSGSEQQLDPVYAAYHVWHQKLPGDAATGYLVAHGSTIYFIDASGQLRVLHDWNDTRTAIAHDLKELLS